MEQYICYFEDPTAMVMELTLRSILPALSPETLPLLLPNLGLPHPFFFLKSLFLPLLHQNT